MTKKPPTEPAPDFFSQSINRRWSHDHAPLVPGGSCAAQAESATRSILLSRGQGLFESSEISVELRCMKIAESKLVEDVEVSGSQLCTGSLQSKAHDYLNNKKSQPVVSCKPKNFE